MLQKQHDVHAFNTKIEQLIIKKNEQALTRLIV